MWVSFDGPAIERWLTQNGQPLWGRERPTTFVWLAAQTGAQSGTVITADDTSELKTAIDAAAATARRPADLAERRRLTASIIWTMPRVNARHAVHAGGHRPALGRRGSAHRTGRRARARPRACAGPMLFQDRSSECLRRLGGRESRGGFVCGAVRRQRQRSRPSTSKSTGSPIFETMRALQSYLESLTFISHVSVEALAGDTISFRLTTRGGAESLQRALSLNGRLQPIAAGENGILRFQLQH